MDIPSPPRDELLTLSVDGLRYTCRILWNDDDPQTVPVLYTHDAFARMHSRGLSIPLSDVATQVQVNLPGSGHSDDLPSDVTSDLFLRALLQVMDEVPLPRVNLVGGSATGPLAYEFARRYPERVRRLVLVATVASASDMLRLNPGPAAALKREDHELTQDEANAILRLLVDQAPDSAVIGRDVVRDRLTEMFGQMTRAELTRLTGRWRALAALSSDPDGRYDGPALVFTGELDAMTHPQACREFAATLTQSVFATIRQADHMAHLERIDEVADLVRRFITDQPLEGLPYLASLECFPEHRPAGVSPSA
ncbi:alpha/beta fold hydrolase [Actinomadura fulvescens]|uniref:Alpha/beta hydrolase n=1 Tax=Actinomadura fulvescens TaxID=46160 RepID=A0ABP6DCW8_9ACTN